MPETYSEDLSKGKNDWEWSEFEQCLIETRNETTREVKFKTKQIVVCIFDLNIETSPLLEHRRRINETENTSLVVKFTYGNLHVVCGTALRSCVGHQSHGTWYHSTDDSDIFSE